MTMTSADVGTIQYDELAAALPGGLIVPGDPGSDPGRSRLDGGGQGISRTATSEIWLQAGAFHKVDPQLGMPPLPRPVEPAKERRVVTNPRTQT